MHADITRSTDVTRRALARTATNSSAIWILGDAVVGSRCFWHSQQPQSRNTEPSVHLCSNYVQTLRTGRTLHLADQYTYVFWTAYQSDSVQCCHTGVGFS